MGTGIATGYRLRNHIPLSGPATREPCDGTESPMRVSLGFTPKWYRDRTGTDFGEAWHLDPAYRYTEALRMRELLSDLFPAVDYFRTNVGGAADGSGAFCPECATISSVFGIMLVSSCYGLVVDWRNDNWPDAAGGAHLPKEELAAIVCRSFFDFSHPESLPGKGGTVRARLSRSASSPISHGPSATCPRRCSGGSGNPVSASTSCP